MSSCVDPDPAPPAREPSPIALDSADSPVERDSGLDIAGPGESCAGCVKPDESGGTSDPDPLGGPPTPTLANDGSGGGSPCCGDEWLLLRRTQFRCWSC